jgi:squalene-associated FAD-dependent desaturase
MAPGHVVVVGAGLAGLSAAVELKRAGCSVEIVERSRLLGGKATSFVLDGVEVDNGQHVFLACCTEFIDFVGSIEVPGNAPLLHVQDRFDAALRARGRHPSRLRAVSLPAPLHLAPALLRYQYLRPVERLAVARALLAAMRETRSGPPPGSQHESFASWLSRHGQSEGSRRAFWNPFFVPALNAPLEEVSAESALFVIRMAFLQDAAAARFGFATVPLARIAEAAAKCADSVHLRTAAVGLRVSGTSSAVEEVLLDDGRRLRCDGVVLAVPPDRLSRILGDAQAFGVGGLELIRTAAIVDVHLWYECAELGFGFVALLDSPVQWVFEKGPGYLCCSLSAADRHVGTANGELVELCHSELTAALPELAGVTLRRGAATRDRDATFVPAPGLIRPGPATARPEVVLAGAWTDTGWPATMESAVRSGRQAARLLLAGVHEREEAPAG